MLGFQTRPFPRLFFPLSALLLITSLLTTLPAPLWSGEPSPPPPNTLQGSTGAVGASLVDFDPMLLIGTVRAPLGTFGPVTEIEYRADGVLFGTTGGGTSNVVTIDPATGAETLVGQHAFGSVNALEFVGDVLYGAFFAAGGVPPGESPSRLVIVDQLDGSLTEVGVIEDYVPVRGLAYHEDTGTMYGVGFPLLLLRDGAGGQGEGEGETDLLFTIDLATAATTEIGDTGLLLGALEFMPGAPTNLFAGEASASGAGRSSEPGSGWGTGSAGPGEGGGAGASIVALDIADGSAVFIADSELPAISGLSYSPAGTVGGGPGIVAIPTLSPWSLALLAVLLVVAALYLQRRRYRPGA